MPYKKEEDDDLFEDDFEFVDDEDDDEDEEDSEFDEDDDEEEAPPAKPKRGVRKTAAAAEPDAAPKGRGKPAPRGRGKSPADKTTPAPPADEEEVDEEEVPQPEMAAEPVGPPADHVVHVYEFRKFKRTLARDFTSDDADKFAAEYNRTSATHSRWAVSGNKSDQPTSKI